MKQFDRSKLKIKPLSERDSKSGLSILIDPDSAPSEISQQQFSRLEIIADSILLAREKNAPVVFAFGAHLIKNGLSRIMIELMKRDYVQHILSNEAVVIHDWELAFHGKTEEDVRRYVAEGQFGLWETGKYIGAAVKDGARNNQGYGESIGRLISKGIALDIALIHPYKDISILAEAYRLNIPISIGVTIGQNITHTHPDLNFESLGKVGGVDFLRFVETISGLQNGVYLSIGSAVLSPQIFEKALSMAKNVNPKLKEYSIYVNDIQPGTWNWSEGEPPKDNPAYYLRFMKTFARMGGSSEYIKMDNIKFLHNLYHLLK
ncbi:hypothetical protein HYT56_01365 [Candidatus Woesearchaeota archaeon]|nr:hypothetical protein [Candidatus Woesearchaeota archaeon]